MSDIDIHNCPFCGLEIDPKNGISHVRNDCQRKPADFEARISRARNRVMEALTVLEEHAFDDEDCEEVKQAQSVLRGKRRPKE